MHKIGTNCKLLLEYLQMEKKKDWHRCARGIVALRQSYSDELIRPSLLPGTTLRSKFLF